MYFLRVQSQHAGWIKQRLIAASALSVIEASVYGATWVQNESGREEEPGDDHVLLIATFQEMTDRVRAIIDTCKLVPFVFSVKVFEIAEVLP